MKKPNLFLLPMKRAILIMAVLSLAVISCRKSREMPGTMTVYLCGSECEYKQMNVDLKSVEMRYKDHTRGNDGWVPLVSGRATNDWLALNNPLGSTVAAGADLQAGEIEQLRFNIGPYNTLKLGNDSTASLALVPSARAGIVVPAAARIEPEGSLELQLQFKPDRSVEYSEGATR